MEVVRLPLFLFKGETRAIIYFYRHAIPLQRMTALVPLMLYVHELYNGIVKVIMIVSPFMH